MANVGYWLGAWVSGGHTDDLGPGDTHHWMMWGFRYGDAISLTAHAVTGAPVPERVLQIENVRVGADSGGGRRLYYTIRNVGNSSVPGYAVGYAMVSQ